MTTQRHRIWIVIFILGLIAAVGLVDSVAASIAEVAPVQPKPTLAPKAPLPREWIWKVKTHDFDDVYRRSL